MATSQNKETFEDYEGFVEKFKPKRTTDDCYTPETVYNAILGWVCKEYGVKKENVVRPFWPGGDYERFDYPDDCVVVDNPPFSIEAKIMDYYIANGIKFFMFAPALTLLNKGTRPVCCICVGATITYDNGAIVPTSFITNLDTTYKAMSSPDLYSLIKEANKAMKKSKTTPVYKFPAYVVTSAMINQYSKYGIQYQIESGECHHIGNMDTMKTLKKSLFGGGLLLSHRAAAREAAAREAAAREAAAREAAAREAAARTHVWELSDREKEIINRLGRREVSVA